MRIRDLIPILERHYRTRGLRTWRGAHSHLQVLCRALGDIDCEVLAPSHIEMYKDERCRTVARGTVNAELALLRSALAIARRQRLVSTHCEIELFPPAPARRGFLRAHEAERLLFAIRVLDADVADAARFLWGLGWRCAEVIRLTWDEADAESGTITLSAERSKTRMPRTVKLHGELRELLQKRWRERSGPWVFHRKGKPIRCFRSVWERACEACGKSGLLVHDLRRSFARNAMLAGIPQPIIMQIAGWKTASVFHRYAIVDEYAVEDALRKIEKFREG